VIYYLTNAAIRNTLQHISECAQGSRLIFDYIQFNQKFAEKELKAVNFFLKFIGEPFHSAFKEEDLKVLLKEFNLELIETPIKDDEYKITYKDPEFKGRVQSQFSLPMFIVKCEVQ